MEIASRSGIKGRECGHLLLVNNAFFPAPINLTEQALRDLKKCKLFKNETVDRCVLLQQAAIDNNAPTVVEWEDNNYIHMSILLKFF